MRAAEPALMLRLLDAGSPAGLDLLLIQQQGACRDNLLDFVVFNFHFHFLTGLFEKLCSGLFKDVRMPSLQAL